jgi:hypothetical protein
VNAKTRDERYARIMEHIGDDIGMLCVALATMERIIAERPKRKRRTR